MCEDVLLMNNIIHDNLSGLFLLIMPAKLLSDYVYMDISDYVYMDISNLIIYLILNKTILRLRCLHELVLE